MEDHRDKINLRGHLENPTPPLEQESFLWHSWKMVIQVLLEHCQWQRAHYLTKAAPFIHGQLFLVLSKINSSYFLSPVPCVALLSYILKFLFSPLYTRLELFPFFNHYSCHMFSRPFSLLVVLTQIVFFNVNLYLRYYI